MYCVLTVLEGRRRGQIKKDGLTRVLEYITAHETGNVSLSDMAAVAGATSHHFVSVFTKAMGLSPHQFVLQERIERAKLHLRNEGLPIAEVSKLTGFQTHEHFSKVFRRIVGVTPKQFREEALAINRNIEGQ
jgi:AraC-like DNA-binding protein